MTTSSFNNNIFMEEDFLLNLEESIYYQIEEFLIDEKINATICKSNIHKNKNKILNYIVDYAIDVIELSFENIEIVEIVENKNDNNNDNCVMQKIHSVFFNEDFVGFNEMDEEEPIENNNMIYLEDIVFFIESIINIYIDNEYYLFLNPLPPQQPIIEHVPIISTILQSSQPTTPPRSEPNTQLTILSNEEILFLKKQIEFLKNQPQPQQRTDEWYEFRNNLMTASNMYKIFGSPSQYNSFICEKCKPPQIYNYVNTESTLHWGQKYEPLTVKLYESIYDTTVEEFGCIQHSKYKCIGASPDGITTGKNHYGRMVEVKNIVNRKITGIPLEAYWIQMQIQMEVCDLNYCDFIETRFKECETMDEWKNKKQTKGVILSSNKYTENTFSTPTYEYYIYSVNIENTNENISAFINTNDRVEKECEENDENEEDTFINKYTKKTTENTNEHTSVNVIWWYLDEMSCVLVQRNKEWFQSSILRILDTWDIILKERKEGFEHRQPKKRNVHKKCLVEYKENDDVTANENVRVFKL
jgi:putative phage-type endonuclease